MQQRFRNIIIGLLAILIAPFFVFAQADDGHDHEHDDEPVAVTTTDTPAPELINVESSAGYVEAGNVTEGLTIDLEISPQSPSTGEPAILEFFVNEKPERTPVIDLELEHEKFMHVIGVRDDLSQFFRIHPENDSEDETPGVYSSEHTFTNPGIYKVWSTVHRSGSTQSFGHKKFSVSGEGSLESEPIEFLVNVIVGSYQVELDLHDTLVAGEEAAISFIVSDVFGRGVALESYLGADMHLAVIKDDLKSFSHAHPDNHIEDETVMEEQSFHFVKEVLAHVEDNDLTKAELSFTTTFSEAGIYKMFAQFRPEGAELPSGEMLVASFYVKVGLQTPEEVAPGAESSVASDGHTDHTHAPVAKGPWYKDGTWWMLFLGSLILMTLLSFFVRRYLNTEK